jgi:hypothetical protein
MVFFIFILFYFISPTPFLVGGTLNVMNFALFPPLFTVGGANLNFEVR